MGGSKQPATTTTTQKVELPKWVDEASQKNYATAEDIANQKYTPYTGERVAGQTDLERQAVGTLQQGIDTSTHNLATSTGVADREANYQAQMVADPSRVNDVTAQSFLSRDINKYMDPNLQSVINPTLDNMNRGIKQGLTAIGDQAGGVGAFGGSRHGVAEAVYGAEGERNKALTEAQLRSNAFTDAAGRITTDNQSALQAAMANQNKDITGEAQKIQVGQGNQTAANAAANVRLGAGELARGTAQTAADTAGRNALLQSQFGATERGINQAQLDQKYNDWSDKKNYKQEGLNLKMAALGMSPYGKTTSGTSTEKSSDSGSGAMQGIGAVATMLPLLFSDRKVKKDITNIGKVPGTDLNQYSFKYKKGFMGRDSAPQIGLMADDVKKKVPGAVQPIKVGGQKVDAVDYGLAIAKAPRDKRNDKGKIRGVYKPRKMIGIGSRMKVA